MEKKYKIFWLEDTTIDIAAAFVDESFVSLKEAEGVLYDTEQEAVERMEKIRALVKEGHEWMAVVLPVYHLTGKGEGK
jgi:hypothetical protein